MNDYIFTFDYYISEQVVVEADTLEDAKKIIADKMEDRGVHETFYELSEGNWEIMHYDIQPTSESKEMYSITFKSDNIESLEYLRESAYEKIPEMEEMSVEQLDSMISSVSQGFTVRRMGGGN